MRIRALDQGANTLWLEAGGATVLFDSYMGHPYVSKSEWFYASARTTAPELLPQWAQRPDLVVLTSEEGDHCDTETLRALPPGTPVLAQKKACSLVGDLGFRDVGVLGHGSTASLFGGQVRVLVCDGFTPRISEHLALFFHDRRSDATIGIAPHGLVMSRRTRAMIRRWLPPHRRLDLWCVGDSMARLRIPGIPSLLLPYRGRLAADIDDHRLAVEFIKPRQTRLMHDTLEERTGFATRHLLEFPPLDHLPGVLAATSPVMGRLGFEPIEVAPP